MNWIVRRLRRFWKRNGEAYEEEGVSRERYGERFEDSLMMALLTKPYSASVSLSTSIVVQSPVVQCHSNVLTQELVFSADDCFKSQRTYSNLLIFDCKAYTIPNICTAA